MVIASFILISAVIGSSAEAWTQFKGSPDHIGAAPAIDDNPGTQRWSFISGAEIHSSPAISENGTVYVTSIDGNLYALDDRGHPIWSYQADSPIWTSPAISSGGNVHFIDRDGTLHSVGPDGGSLWKFRSREEVYHSSPAIDDSGNIYFGTAGGTLYCIRSDGVPKWLYKAGDFIDASPSLSSDGTVYVGSGDGKVHAVGSFGRPRWEHPYATGGSVSSAVCIAPDGNLHIASADGYVHSLRTNGTLIRKVRVGDMHLSSPSLDRNGNIYVGTMAGDLVSITGSGSVRWRFTTNGAVESSPIVSGDDRVLFGSVDGDLYCIDTEGSLKWTFNAGDWIESSSCAVDYDGTLYIASGDGILYCIGRPYPDAPRFLMADPGDGMINLTWSAPLAEDILNYRLYRSVNGGPFTMMIEINANRTQHVDRGLTNGATYSYRLSAVNSVGEGPFSNTATDRPYPSTVPPENGNDEKGFPMEIFVGILVALALLLLIWNFIPSGERPVMKR